MARGAILEQWASGAFQAATIEETALANANAMGSVNELNRLIDIDFEVINEVLSSE